MKLQTFRVIRLNSKLDLSKGAAYLSVGPPNFLTIFLNEKMVPKINLASSSALRVLDCEPPSATPLD